MSAQMSKLEDISQTFCLFSCCRQWCWCHWSCRSFSVSIPHSPCCPSVMSNHKQGTISQTTSQSTTVPTPVILNEMNTCIWQTVISQLAIHRLPLQQFLLAFPVGQRTDDGLSGLRGGRQLPSTGGGQGWGAGSQRSHSFLQYSPLLLWWDSWGRYKQQKLCFCFIYISQVL